jgi:Leucine-rich repeat (LRR) protein
MKNYRLFGIGFLVTFILIINRSYGASLGSNCDPNCDCDLTSNVLTIQCRQNVLTNFTLPNPSLSPGLGDVIQIVIANSFLKAFPSEICQYSKVIKLDLSNNRIGRNLSRTNLNCLFSLQELYLSNNLIENLDEQAFDFTINLRTLDLSFNQISTIPHNLFKYKLKSLKNLYLQNNKLQQLEPWYFYLENIEVIDLKNNSIARLTNNMGWNLNSEQFFPQLRKTNLIDMRYNRLTTFDDSTLKLYNICNKVELTFFIQLLYSMRLDENPFVCSCENSFNLLNYIKELVKENGISLSNYIFLGICQSPAEYSGQSIFNFVGPNACNGVAFSAANCPIRTTTTSTTTLGPTTTPITLAENQFINIPEFQLADTLVEKSITASFNDGLLAGVIVGLFFVLLLFFILLYCICPIEILSILFTCCPCFYRICPCKSGAKREKEYDLFISYNLVNEKWLNNHLIPFIKEKYLVTNYILHYNKENRNKEVFGPYIKEIMSKSSCILFILSDQFLMKEWNNKEFREHLKYLITKEKTRFVCVQMHDICDEEVEEYFRQKIQLPAFVSLENDELLFWNKLRYVLYTNDVIKSVMPLNTAKNYKARPNDDIDFDKYDINRPIIHLHGRRDPLATDKPKFSLSNVSKNINKKTKSMFSSSKTQKSNKNLIRENSDTDSFVAINRIETPMNNYVLNETPNASSRNQVFDRNLTNKRSKTKLNLNEPLSGSEYTQPAIQSQIVYLDNNEFESESQRVSERTTQSITANQNQPNESSPYQYRKNSRNLQLILNAHVPKSNRTEDENIDIKRISFNSRISNHIMKNESNSNDEY